MWNVNGLWFVRTPEVDLYSRWRCKYLLVLNIGETRTSDSGRTRSSQTFSWRLICWCRRNGTGAWRLHKNGPPVHHFRDHVAIAEVSAATPLKWNVKRIGKTSEKMIRSKSKSSIQESWPKRTPHRLWLRSREYVTPPSQALDVSSKGFRCTGGRKRSRLCGTRCLQLRRRPQRQKQCIFCWPQGFEELRQAINYSILRY